MFAFQNFTTWAGSLRTNILCLSTNQTWRVNPSAIQTLLLSSGPGLPEKKKCNKIQLYYWPEADAGAIQFSRTQHRSRHFYKQGASWQVAGGTEPLTEPSRASWLAKATFPFKWAKNRWCHGHYRTWLCYSNAVFFSLTEVQRHMRDKWPVHHSHPQWWLSAYVIVMWIQMFSTLFRRKRKVSLLVCECFTMDSCDTSGLHWFYKLKGINTIQ